MNTEIKTVVVSVGIIVAFQVTKGIIGMKARARQNAINRMVDVEQMERDAAASIASLRENLGLPPEPTSENDVIILKPVLSK